MPEIPSTSNIWKCLKEPDFKITAKYVRVCYVLGYNALECENRHRQNPQGWYRLINVLFVDISFIQNIFLGSLLHVFMKLVFLMGETYRQ